MIGGIIADYIGRKRTMILAILAYSLTTGLSALSWNWESLAILRFFVGVAIGSEWATGASIVAELWPDHARGKGGGLMQCGAGLGAILASVVWLLIGSTGPNAWRWMYLIGVLPALMIFWIRLRILKSPKWERSNERRSEARDLKRHGIALSGEHAALTRFTLVDLFADRTVRRPLIGSLLMMLSVTLAFWGVGHIHPDLCRFRCGRRICRQHNGRVWRAGHRRVRHTWICQPGFSRRCVWPQAYSDALLLNVPNPDAGGLSLGRKHLRAALLGRRVWLLHVGDLGVGADLASGIVPYSDAEHGDRFLL